MTSSRARIGGLAALLVLVGLTQAARADRLEAELAAAARAGDRAELARVAERLGPARLARLIAQGQAAALDAAPELEAAWTLLPAIGLRLDTLEGARAAARIVHGLADPDERARLEVDVDVLDATRARCAAGAVSPAPGPTRAELIACAVELGTPLRPELVFDGAPEVRATAISLLAASTDRSWRAVLEANAVSEAPAAAAVAALCAGDPRATVRALGASARATLERLAAGAEPAAAPHLARCKRALRGR